MHPKRSPDRQPRRWQISTRGILLIVTACACCLGYGRYWYWSNVTELDRQREAARVLQEICPGVGVHWDEPEWSFLLLGEGRILSRVRHLSFGGPFGESKRFVSATHVSDKEAQIVKEFVDLEALDLSHTRVEDSFVRELSTLTSLRRVNLCFTNVTSDGMICLCATNDITVLYIDKAHADSGTLDKLKTSFARLNVAVPNVIWRSL
jgi:hypothetical protein